MKGVKFTLSGRFAFFKKPEFNKFGKVTHHYITFNQIPKTYLLGFLGALIGLNSFEYKEGYLDELKDLKVCIIPKEPHFIKENHTFSDSSGLLFYTKGGNILIQEEFLVNPSWDIIIPENAPFYKNIKENLFNKKNIYNLYLGKNELFAKIDKVEEVFIEKYWEANEDVQAEFNIMDLEVESENFDLDEFVLMDSLFPAKEDLTIEDFSKNADTLEEHFLYKEYLPVKFNESMNYEYKLFYFTNQFVKKNKIDTDKIFSVKLEDKELKVVFF